jgi:bifunctional NMN adenylyltransferase/nudix hydrolase
MLLEKYPDIEVYYIEDVNDDDFWSKTLDRHINRTVGPGLKVVLYGSRDSFVKAYKGKYLAVELVPNKVISASEIRKEAGIRVKHTLDFRIGIVHAVQNQFPSFKATVDMAVINFDTEEILLARKPRRNLFCFPGGFTDPAKDKSAEDAAIRETKEETGLTTTVESYVGSTFIDDWRYRHERDKILTFLYAMRYIDGVPIASDDIEFVSWKPLLTVAKEEISPNHHLLLDMVRKWYFTTKK